MECIEQHLWPIKSIVKDYLYDEDHKYSSILMGYRGIDFENIRSHYYFILGAVLGGYIDLARHYVITSDKLTAKIREQAKIICDMPTDVINTDFYNKLKTLKWIFSSDYSEVRGLLDLSIVKQFETDIDKIIKYGEQQDHRFDPQILIARMFYTESKVMEPRSFSKNDKLIEFPFRMILSQDYSQMERFFNDRQHTAAWLKRIADYTKNMNGIHTCTIPFDLYLDFIYACINVLVRRSICLNEDILISLLSCMEIIIKCGRILDYLAFIILQIYSQQQAIDPNYTDDKYFALKETVDKKIIKAVGSNKERKWPVFINWVTNGEHDYSDGTDGTDADELLDIKINDYYRQFGFPQYVVKKYKIQQNFILHPKTFTLVTYFNYAGYISPLDIQRAVLKIPIKHHTDDLLDDLMNISEIDESYVWKMKFKFMFYYESATDKFLSCTLRKKPIYDGIIINRYKRKSKDAIYLDYVSNNRIPPMEYLDKKNIFPVYNSIKSDNMLRSATSLPNKSSLQEGFEQFVTEHLIESLIDYFLQYVDADFTFLIPYIIECKLLKKYASILLDRKISSYYQKILLMI
jgi:hypothetical protein